MAEKSRQDDQDRPAYEDARAELIEVVRALEAGGTTLEESLALWERGEKLATLCQEWLAGAPPRPAGAPPGGRGPRAARRPPRRGLARAGRGPRQRGVGQGAGQGLEVCLRRRPEHHQRLA